jgi:glucan-binding YG repeat protein
VSVVPYPQDDIDQNGGVFEGAIYAQYLIPDNPAAFITVGWFQDNLVAYLNQNGYMKAGNGVQLNSDGQIFSLDSGLLV